jgi:SAM-dependent methyltransferase
MSFYARFADHYERIFPFRPATRDFLRAHLPGRGTVLDLGCGPGHHAAALAAAGLDLVGLDLDGAMIAAARAAHPGVRFAEADLAALASLVPRADGAYCIGNVLPHLPPDARDGFLDALAGVLQPGAPWIVQTVNFDRLLPLDAPHDFPPLDAGGGLRFLRRYEPGPGGSIRFRTSLREGDREVFRGEERLWPARADDLAADHARRGLRQVVRRGDFAGAPFDPATSPGCVQVYVRT